MLHAFFISARPTILPSNSRMIPDEIRERFAAIALIRNAFAFIFGIAPLLALHAIGRVLRDEPRLVGYPDSGTDLRRLVMQQFRLAKILTQRDGASMLDPIPKTASPFPLPSWLHAPLLHASFRFSPVPHSRLGLRRTVIATVEDNGYICA